MTCYSDIPTLNDRLDWTAEVIRMKNRMLESPTPHVFGIHGDWGIGKTSFMRQLQIILGGEISKDATVDMENCISIASDQRRVLAKQVVTIWFDAWRYQNEKAPIVALLQEMRHQMSTSRSLRQRFKKTSEIALYSVLDSLSDVGKVIGMDGLPSVENIEKRADAWERDNYAGTIQTDSIRDHLSQAIKFLLPHENSRVIVFIDDLDRCNSRAVIRLLEGLKIYLSIPKCVFVLGMNERVLVDAIRDELSYNHQVPTDEVKLRAAHYLEKICTDIFRVPSPRSPVALIKKWIKEVDQGVALQTAIGDISCLPPNPRRLKALVNQWERFSKCVPFPIAPDAQKIWAVRVLVAVYIHQFHRDLWERWYFNANFWVEIQAWCSGERMTPKPDWARNLKLTYDEATANSNVLVGSFPNPGDVENFWIGVLILEYRDHLLPDDFKPLLLSLGV